MAAKADIQILIDAVNKAKAKIRSTFTQLDKSGRTTASTVKSVNAQSRKLAQTQKALQTAIGKTEIKFQGWALSIMFFGMAIKRVFDQIWKSASKTFDDVSHSVEGTVTGFDRLNGAMTYLKFVSGQALEPLAEVLFPIIDAVSMWVEDNQELFRTLVVVAGILGGLLMTVGMLVLGITGMINAWSTISGVISGVTGAISGVTGAMGTVLTVIGWVIAIVILLWMAWKTNLGNMQDFVKETFGIVWDTIKRVIANIKQIFKGLFQVLEGLFTGDFEKIGEGIVNIIAGAIKLIINLFLGLGSAIVNVFIWVKNLVSDIFFNIGKIVLGIIKGTIDRINSILPDRFQIGTGGLDNAIDALEKLKMEKRMDYITRDQVAKAATGAENIINNVTMYITGEGGSEETAKAVADRIEATK